MIPAPLGALEAQRVDSRMSLVKQGVIRPRHFEDGSGGEDRGLAKGEWKVGGGSILLDGGDPTWRLFE